MGQRFYQGRTNNHLTWVMVDATDFATPESALSAATKIKIYGKLQGATGVNFVTSGVGSLTNDIQHVGASALGIYTIALAKADLSDASAAWYDQYVVSLSATGAAYQALVVEGVLTKAILSDLSALVSDVQSAVAVGNSRVLLAQSMASDAASAAQQANSRVLINQSRISDAQSMLSDFYSDFQSRVTGAVATASDVASKVWAEKYTAAGNNSASTFGSAFRILQSMASDIDSALTSRFSDLLSLVGTTGVQINASSLSDIRSAISAGPAATVTASDISDIASAVWANTIGARVDSRLLVVKSQASDIYSQVAAGVPLDASTISDIRSAISAGPAVTVTASDISDIASAVGVKLTSRFSDLLSHLDTTGVQINASSLSDLRSAITAATATVTASDISDIASAVQATQRGITFRG